MSWIDISVPFADTTPPWPGDTPFSCAHTWRISRGDSVNLSAITASPHVGTHADAPFHVLESGALADRLPLAPFIGPAVVLDVTRCTGELSVADLEHAGLRGWPERILLRTGRSVASGSFPNDWATLSLDTARALVDRGLRLLGVDTPSVDARENRTLDVHKALFNGGAFVLENLNLSLAPVGAVSLYAPPLLVGAIDAAPARALVRTSE